MANMSYCRFRNTEKDLNDCLDVLQQGEGIHSKEEKQSALRMLKSFLGYCEDEGIIEEFDMDRLEEIVEDCCDV